MWATTVKAARAVLIAGAILACTAVGQASAGDVEAVVEKLTQATLSLSYEGERHVYNFHPSTPEVTTYRILHTPAGERREYSGATARVVVIDDGQHQWMYRPDQKLLIRRPSPSAEFRRQLAQRNETLLRQNYKIEVVQHEATMGGRPCVVAKFAPRVGVDRPVRTIWMDSEKGLPLRTEVYDAGGLRVMTFFSSISYAPAPAEESLVLKVPPATRLEAEAEEKQLPLASFAKAVDFQVYEPRSLPPGFALVAARLKGHGPATELRLLYSDGLTTLSMFQRQRPSAERSGGPPAVAVKIGDSDGDLYHFGLLKMVEWERPPASLTMVGDVCEKELLATARSVK